MFLAISFRFLTEIEMVEMKAYKIGIIFMWKALGWSTIHFDASFSASNQLMNNFHGLKYMHLLHVTC